MFQAEIDALLLGIAHNLLPAVEAVLLHRGVTEPGFPHARKCDHAGRAEFHRPIDALAELLHALGVVRPLGGAVAESVTADQGRAEAEFPQSGIVAGIDAFDRGHSHSMTGVDEFGIGQRVETPTHDGMPDAPVLDSIIRGGNVNPGSRRVRFGGLQGPRAGCQRRHSAGEARGIDDEIPPGYGRR